MNITKSTPESTRNFSLIATEVDGYYGFDLLQSKEDKNIFALRYKGHILKELTRGKTLRKGAEFRKAVDILRHLETKAA